MLVVPFHAALRLLTLVGPISSRRQLIAQALLYGGTFIVIAVSLWFRHRGFAEHTMEHSDVTRKDEVQEPCVFCIWSASATVGRR